jgi:hypothetical protein
MHMVRRLCQLVGEDGLQLLQLTSQLVPYEAASLVTCMLLQCRCSV